MKLHKCPSCKTYTLKEICDKCKKQTTQAGYKFIQYSKDNSKIYFKR